MTQSQTRGEGLGFAAILRMLCTSWRLILVGLFFAFMAASLYLVSTPSLYEAGLDVKISAISTTRGERPVESAEGAMAQMRGAAFQNVVVESLGWRGDKRESLFRSSFQVTSPAPNQLKVRVFGYQPEEARRAAEASLAALAKTHHGLARKLMGAREREFAKMRADIEESETFLRRLEALNENLARRDGKEILGVLQAIREENVRLRGLHRQEQAMREAIEAGVVHPTMAVGLAAVSSQPTYPKARRIWLFAAIGGLFFGILLVLLRTIFRMDKDTVSAPINDRSI